jgi:hypothetical protein
LESLIEATYTRERQSHLRRANLGIEKLRILIRLATNLRLIDERRYEHAARSLDETGRLIGGWMKARHARDGGMAGRLRHDLLFDDIANFQALHRTYGRAIKGKRKKPGAAAFTANLERELLTLERQLLDRSYRPGRYTVIEVHDPKRQAPPVSSHAGPVPGKRIDRI